MRSRGEQVHEQQMDAEIQGGGGLGGEGGDRAGAVLIGRRDDLDEGDESMAADVADGQRSAAVQGFRLDRVPAPRPRGRVDQCTPPVAGGNGSRAGGSGGSTELACRNSRSAMARPACCSARA
jgi:hypothetical protein